MQCDRLQQRIDEILDRREDLRSDADLMAHLEDCAVCDRLVGAYETMLLGLDLTAAAEPAECFVERTLATARRRHRAGLIRRTGTWATAAALLVAVGAALWTTLRPPGHGDGAVLADRTPRSAAAPQARRPVESSTVSLAEVCQATGRNLAVLPQTVRRVASHPETDRIVGHIRPLAEPVGAAWEVLLRAWPGAPSRTGAIPDTDTGFVTWQRAQRA